MDGWMDRYYIDRCTLYPDIHFHIDKYKFCVQGGVTKVFVEDYLWWI